MARKGQRIAVLGPNGSGKTTLLYHLLGLLRSEEGLVRVLGVDPAREWKSIRRRIGVVLQNVDEQILAPSVLDDVAFSPRQYGLPESEVRDLVADALARVGIEHLAARVPHNLSGGEKRKVALAGALVMRPELLVLDEPFEGLDPASRDELIEIVSEHAGGGGTVIMSTHDIDTVPEFADYCYVLSHGGTIVLEGTPAVVFAQASTLADGNIRPPLIAEMFARLAQLDPSAPPAALTVEAAASRSPSGSARTDASPAALAVRERCYASSAEGSSARMRPMSMTRCPNAAPHARAASISSAEGTYLQVKSGSGSSRPISSRRAVICLVAPLDHRSSRTRRDLALRLQAAQVLQVARGPMQHAVVQRWRAHQQRPSVEEVPRDVRIRRRRQIEEPDVDASRHRSIGDLARKVIGGSPHRAVCDDELVERVAGDAAVVGVDQRGEVTLAPDDAVARRDRLAYPSGLRDLPDGLAHLSGDGHEDVREVDDELLGGQLEPHLVGEARARREVLAERVVGHERATLRAVREHRIGPVDHGHRHELERETAQVERVVGARPR